MGGGREARRCSEPARVSLSLRAVKVGAVPTGRENPTDRSSRTQWDDNGWHCGRMYVIFPLEDLLDPYSGLSRRSQAQLNQRINAQKNSSEPTTSEASCPPSSQPNQVTTVQPSTSTTNTTTSTAATSSPSAQITVVSADISRSGSVKSQSKCPSSALKPISQVSPHSTQPLQQPTSSAVSSLPPRSPKLSTKNSQSSVKPKISQPQQKSDLIPLQNLNPQQKAKSFLFGVLTPKTSCPDIQISSHNVSVCDTNTVTSNADSNTWPSNSRSTTLVSQANLGLSVSSARNKQQIRPLVSQDSPSSTLLDTTTLSPKRKTALVDPPSLPKDLVIKEKSELSSAKDSGGISAKEFNHDNVGCGDVTLGNKDLAVSSKVNSPLGSGSRTGGLVRHSSFSSRDFIAHQKLSSSGSASRSCLSGGSFSDQTSGAGFYSGRSSSSSAKSRASEGRTKSKETIVGNSSPYLNRQNKIQGSPSLNLSQKSGSELQLSNKIQLRSQTEIPLSKFTSKQVLEPCLSSHPTKIVEDLSSSCPPPKFAQDLSLQTRSGKFSAQYAPNSVGPGGGKRISHVMAAGGDAGLRHLTHPALNEPLKSHSNVTFKLLKTGKKATN